MKMQDQELLVSLLKQLKPGFLPYPIFEQIARLTTLSIIEFVPLRRKDDGSVEVLLLDRGDDDPLWPKMVHTPGTVIRPGDNDSNKFKAFERITKDELKNTKLSTPVMVGTMLHQSKRGWEFAQIYWVEVIGKPENGVFYSCDNLPSNIVASQPAFIKQAVDNFITAK